MSSFPILDLVVGMIFIYFLLSIISSSAVEMILTLVNARAKLLEEWLYTIFNKPVQGTEIKLGQAIMDHCSVTALSGKGKSPSYIDAKNFTSALLEKITFDPNDPDNIATDFNALITKIKNTDLLPTELKRIFIAYAYEAVDSYERVTNKTISAFEIFRSKIEDWYNSSMDRLTGNLKRKYSRPFTFWVATVTVLLLNADSINIAKYLYSNPDARAKVISQAYSIATDSTQMFNKKLVTLSNTNDTTVPQLKATLQNGLNTINEAKAMLNENLPFGWTADYFTTLFPTANFWSGILSLLAKITGLIATILAIMLGAPFWFDLLNKITNLRGTGAKPATAAAGSSTSATQSPAPITVNVSTNKDEEAVG